MVDMMIGVFAAPLGDHGAVTAENVAEEFDITQQSQGALVRASHQKALPVIEPQTRSPLVFVGSCHGVIGLTENLVPEYYAGYWFMAALAILVTTLTSALCIALEVMLS